MATVETPIPVSTHIGNDSPLIPQEEAAEPAEGAGGEMELELDKNNSGKTKAVTTVSQKTDSRLDADSFGTDMAVHPDGILTKKMIEEEKQLHRSTEEEEERLRAEQNQIWKNMDDELREQRYKRLQFLLSKSNMYTQYLIDRMRRQQEDEKKARERQAKRQMKQEMKKQEQQIQKDKVEANTEVPVSSPRRVKSEGSPNKSVQSKRASRGSTKQPQSDSQGSQPMEESSQDSQGAISEKRGRKRKADLPAEDIRHALQKASKKKKVEAASDNSIVDNGGVITDPKSGGVIPESSVDVTNNGGVIPDSGGVIGENCRIVSDSGVVQTSDVDSISRPVLDDCTAESAETRTAEGVEGSPQIECTKLSSDTIVSESRDRAGTGADISESGAPKEQNRSQQGADLSHKDKIFSAAQPSLFTGGTLRQYQLDGFSWLRMLYENGVNGILADEMGLGKTVQCIAMISHLVSKGVPGPYLVCAPLSTLPNWLSEFKRFAPKVPVLLYHGDKDERTRLRCRMVRKVLVKKNVEVQPVLITSYEITMRDRKYLQNYDWKYLIVDEGHRIKNTQCRLIRELRLYQNTHRLLLTGTPLQNNLSELWSLLNFLLPEIFDDLGSFEAWFDVEHIADEGADEKIVAEEQGNNVLSMLHQILTPFMLRRLKSDVELFIPPKKEILVYAPLTATQQTFYAATIDKSIFNMIEEKNHGEKKVELNEKGRPMRKSTKKKVNYDLMIASEKDLEEPSKGKKKRKNIQKEEEELEIWIQAVLDSNTKEPEKKKQKASQVTIRLQNIMMQLRKCCNHPYLLEYPLDEKTGEYKLDENIVKICGKMMVLDQMLAELKKRGHKVLLFSQMTRMLDIIEDYCVHRNFNYCRLDGSYRVDERQEQMASFNTNPDKFIFLLSTRAGGLGINLTGADTVIIYDSDWNPQSDLQAQDRCHRIGQTKPVVVYRYVTANTIDQKIVERAAAKRKLEKMVIHQGKFKSGISNFNTSLKQLSPEDLLALLKSTDHQSVVKGQDGNVINAKELDMLLDRSDLYKKWTKKKGKKGSKSPVKSGVKMNSNKTGNKDVEGLFQVLDVEEAENTLDTAAKGDNPADQ